MAAERFVRRPFSDREVQPFASAEEAWLWFAQCQLARIEGVRFTAGCGAVARPCDPDDIYRVVDRLFRQGGLSSAQVSVLGRFGCRLAAPDPWAGDTPDDARQWAEAMARLEPALRQKGVVA